MGISMVVNLNVVPPSCCNKRDCSPLGLSYISIQTKIYASETMYGITN